ncbi:hypothetical protein [Burkholderia dolosa]|uniref:hypothetical protein n=1 Tax=Burkholderia dolosa TaxID=152500 RepID=UPI0027D33223|nr:hypothetical protein [Burkholderia dolosa]
MFIQSFALELKRVAQAARTRALVRAVSSCIRRPALPRPLDCMLVGATLAAIALAALLCAAGSRVGFSFVWRVGGWLP